MGRRRIKRISTIILRENSKFLATSMHVWFDEKDSREEEDSYIIVIRYLVESWEEEEADHGEAGAAIPALPPHVHAQGGGV